MPEAVIPPDATSFYLQRLNCRQMLEPMLRRSLTRSEQRALLSEAKCSTCFRVRSQLAEGVKLQCCQRCGWGWACTEHAAAYLEGPHKACCGTYALAVESEAALHAFWKENGKLPSNTLQARRRAYSPLPRGWDEYFMWRPLQLQDVGLRCNLTKRLSQPLTILWALERLMPRDELSSMSGLTLHILGASGFEVAADAVYEELLHLLPGLRKLHVAFIGPELGDIMTEDSHQHTQEPICCTACIEARCTRTFSYHHCTYHEYVAHAEAAAALAAGRDAATGAAASLKDGKLNSPRTEELSGSMSALTVSGSGPGSRKAPLPRLWEAPDLAVAFNSGMYESDRVSWKPTLDLLELRIAMKGMMTLLADKTAVGMAKMRGEESAALDVAVVKATLQDEVVPKEKHVRTLKIACTGSAPRQQVNYVIHQLAKRLEDKPGWLVALKSLIVFHRLMREVDTTFQEEMLRYSERTGANRLLRMDAFADHTTKETWDFSAWIRVYSVYLDERLAVFRQLKFDPEQESANEAKDSKLKSCSGAELLEHLPQVHKLLTRLIMCVPEGASQTNEVVLQACSMVLGEIRAIYKVVYEGVMNLMDKFFEMDRPDAIRSLELYKENIVLNDKLNAFYSAINNIQMLRGAVQFPTLQALPADFLTTLEDFIRDSGKGVADASASTASRRAGPLPSTMAKGSTFVVKGGTTSTAFSGGTALQIGAPTNASLVLSVPPSGAPSPITKPAAEVNLLDFDSGTPHAPTAEQQRIPPAAPAALAIPAAYDFFNDSFSSPSVAAPAPVPPPQQQQQQFQPFQQQQQFPPQQQQHPPQQQQAFQPSFPTQAPAPTQAYYSPPSQPQQQQQQQLPAHNPFGGAPPALLHPHQTPQERLCLRRRVQGALEAFSPFGPPATVAPPAPPPASSNPFAANPFAASAPAPPGPSNPFGGRAPSPTNPPAASNPFGGMSVSPAAASNPFNAGGGGWGGGGTTAGKMDPLMGLSADMWGVPNSHAAAVSPPLKDFKKPTPSPF
ncbi:MAG: hypothetical protein WDW38_000724 [Sanguina aurantia]